MKKLIILLFVICMAIMPLTSRAQTGPVFPQAEITPENMTFDDTRVGETSATQTFTVTKTQSVLPLIIFGARLADTVNFAIVNDGCAGKTLNGTQTCTIDVAFNPTERASFETSITLFSISQEVVDNASMKGRGVAPEVTLSTTSINFGDETVGTPSIGHQVLLVNSGTASLAITSITAGGEFSETDDCGTEVAANASCTLLVTFTPAATGVATGTVTITDDAADSPQTIALQGNGIAPGNPDIGLSTHAIDFGGVPVGIASAPETVVLLNTGTVNVTITSITASGDFSQTNDCPATLVPAAFCSIEIVFQPSATGLISGTVTFVDNATDSPQIVTLTGRGLSPDTPSMELSTSLVDFGDQTVNTTSNAQTITLTNVGTAEITGDSSVIEGTGAANFSSIDHCTGVTITIGGTCTIDVKFTPTDDGAMSAVLTITNNSSDSPQSVDLTGTGVGGGTSGGSGCSLVPPASAAGASGIAMIAFACASLAIARRRRK